MGTFYKKKKKKKKKKCSPTNFRNVTQYKIDLVSGEFLLHSEQWDVFSNFIVMQKFKKWGEGVKEACETNELQKSALLAILMILTKIEENSH